MSYQARPDILHEASYRQLLDNPPNVAVLPWGATEAHNYHLPYGTDVIEGVATAEAAVRAANAAGGRCVLLPAIPYGIDHSQLYQIATISLRASTQQLILRDVAESLVRQGIDRLVVANFHGGNEFKSMIRDIMFDLPIFIVQVHVYQVAPETMKIFVHKGDHANEFETSLMLHLTPEWVAPLETAGDGAETPSKLPAVSGTPGVWCCRDWQTLTESSGTGDPRQATAAKGKIIFDAMVSRFAEVLRQLSAAQRGDFPFVIREAK